VLEVVVGVVVIQLVHAVDEVPEGVCGQQAVVDDAYGVEHQVHAHVQLMRREPERVEVPRAYVLRRDLHHVLAMLG
jgi:hypothetical protein